MGHFNKAEAFELSAGDVTVIGALSDKLKNNRKLAALGTTPLALVLSACGGSSTTTTSTASTNVLTLTKSADTYSASSVTGFTVLDVSTAKFNVADATANAYEIKLDATGTGVLEFDFADAGDTVTLAAGSKTSGFTTLKVTDGTLDATDADLSGITRVEVASGIKISLAQIKDIPTLVANSATSEITVEVASEAEATELVSLISAGTVKVFADANPIKLVAAPTVTIATETLTTKVAETTASVKAVTEAPADTASTDTDTATDTGTGDTTTDTGTATSSGGGSVGADFSMIKSGVGTYIVGTANGDVTATVSGDLATFTPTTGVAVSKIAADVTGLRVDDITLTSTAAIADGKTITGNGNLTVTALDATAAADLSLITATGTLTANVADDVTFTGDLGTFAVTVDTGKTLTTTAAKATGLAITGAGGVAITALDADADADLSSITATGTLTANVADDVTFTGDLGTFGVTVDSGKTLTTTALKATGLTMTGAGGVTLTALNADADADLSSITVSGTKTVNVAADVTFTGNLGTFSTTVASTKTMTAAHSVVTGKTISGTGNLSITSMVDATDVSSISTSGTITVAGVTTAANLTALDALTTTAVVASDITAISGTVTEAAAVLTAHGASTITIDDDYTATLTGTATSAQLAALNTDTSGDINIAAVTAVTLEDTGVTFSIAASGLVEGAGTYTITGGTSGDTITGGDNADIIDANGGADTVVGGGGDDKITTDLLVSAADAVDGGTGTDELVLVGTVADANSESIAIDLRVGETDQIAAINTTSFTGNQTGIENFDVSGVVISANAATNAVTFTNLNSTTDGTTTKLVGTTAASKTAILDIADAVDMSGITNTKIDVLHLADGGVTLTIDVANTTDVTEITGGSGTDVLVIAEAAAFDLSAITSFSGLETINMAATDKVATSITINQTGSTDFGGALTGATGTAQTLSLSDSGDAAIDITGVTNTKIETISLVHDDDDLKIDVDNLTNVTAINGVASGNAENLVLSGASDFNFVTIALSNINIKATATDAQTIASAVGAQTIDLAATGAADILEFASTTVGDTVTNFSGGTDKIKYDSAAVSAAAVDDKQLAVIADTATDLATDASQNIDGGSDNFALNAEGFIIVGTNAASNDVDIYHYDGTASASATVTELLAAGDVVLLGTFGLIDGALAQGDLNVL